MFSLFCCRSTMTWKVPSAATKRLRSRMDCNRTGWLRSVSVSENGLSKPGSTLIARSPRQSPTIATNTTPVKASTRTIPPRRSAGVAGSPGAGGG